MINYSHLKAYSHGPTTLLPFINTQLRACHRNLGALEVCHSKEWWNTSYVSLAMIFPPSVSLPHSHHFHLECSPPTVLGSKVLPSLQGSAQISSLPLSLPYWTSPPYLSSLDSCLGATHFGDKSPAIFHPFLCLIHQSMGQSDPTTSCYMACRLRMVITFLNCWKNQKKKNICYKGKLYEIQIQCR